MKKRLFIFCALVIAVAFFAASGCGTTEGDEDPVSIIKASGPIGSGWYPISISMGDIWMDELKFLTVTVTEGGGIANIRTVNQGRDAHIGFAFTHELVQAIMGVGTFDEPLTEIGAIANAYPTWVNVAVLDDSNIYTIEDLFDKKIAPGDPGFSADVAARVIFEAYGVSYDDMRDAGQLSYGGYADAAMMLRDGLVDAIIAIGAPEVTALSEVDAMKPIRLIPLSQEAIKAIDAKGIGYATSPPIPAGTYRNQKEEVPTILLFTNLFASRAMSDDLVYKLTKVFWENLERLREDHPVRAGWIQLDTAFEGLKLDYFHPGALKYYRELGLID